MAIAGLLLQLICGVVASSAQVSAQGLALAVHVSLCMPEGSGAMPSHCSCHL